MFGHYLPNKNEDATVVPKSKFHELNQGLQAQMSSAIGDQKLRLSSGAQFKAGKSMFPEPEGNRTCSMELLHFRSSLHNLEPV